MQQDEIEFGARLTQSETVWRDHQPWLLSCGYKLRPRYNPNWIPSWRGTGKSFSSFEDAKILRREFMDAVRLSDGATVALYIVQSASSDEIAIWRYFSSKPVQEDPNNHCIPIYNELQSPLIKDTIIVVAPMLNDFDLPGFESVGEAVEFFRQIFRGLCFMHDNSIAHCNIVASSLVMDASSLYLEPYHPQASFLTLDGKRISTHVTRTERPVRYYLSNFSKSVWGKSLGQADPFAYDVAKFGDFIKSYFLDGDERFCLFQGFDFLQPLVDSMVRPNPEDRPTMNEAYQHFLQIVRSLSSWQLRARVSSPNEWTINQPSLWFGHFKKQLTFAMKGVSAVPVHGQQEAKNQAGTQALLAEPESS